MSQNNKPVEDGVLLYQILADYSDDLRNLKRRDGKHPADAAVARLLAWRSQGVGEATDRNVGDPTPQPAVGDELRDLIEVLNGPYGWMADLERLIQEATKRAELEGRLDEHKVIDEYLGKNIATRGGRADRVVYVSDIHNLRGKELRERLHTLGEAKEKGGRDDA